jgi:hypothetical protein
MANEEQSRLKIPFADESGLRTVYSDNFVVVGALGDGTVQVIFTQDVPRLSHIEMAVSEGKSVPGSTTFPPIAVTREVVARVKMAPGQFYKFAQAVAKHAENLPESFKKNSSPESMESRINPEG